MEVSKEKGFTASVSAVVEEDNTIYNAAGTI